MGFMIAILLGVSAVSPAVDFKRYKPLNNMRCVLVWNTSDSPFESELRRDGMSSYSVVWYPHAETMIWFLDNLRIYRARNAPSFPLAYRQCFPWENWDDAAALHPYEEVK